MELRRFRYFSAVAAEGSLGRASRALGIAQPALSRQMQLLETELGVQLFQRVATGMRLTEEGDYLRDAINHPIQQIDAAIENVRSFATRSEATCTLGLPPAVMQVFGMGVMRRLTEALPNLKLRVIEEDSARLTADLLRGTVDVAVLRGISPDDRLFHAEILSETLVLVGPAGSDLAAKGQVKFTELGDYPLIVPSRPAGLPIMLEKLAARMASRIHIAHEVNSLRLTKDLVKAGVGYAVLSPVAFAAEAAAGELVSAAIVDPVPVQTVHFAVQEHWRVPRSIYLTFHRVFYDEWMSVVDRGEWPAMWLYDRDELSRHF
jgi:LysR family nitrogen assimilation transcriptional regulator